jgi:hypothetical protein
MCASATDVIVARARQVDDDLRGMLWWSVGGHVVLLMLVVLWASSVRTEAGECSYARHSLTFLSGSNPFLSKNWRNTVLD